MGTEKIAPSELIRQANFEAHLTNIQWSKIEAKRGLKDLELDLLRLKQNGFKLPEDDKKEAKEFVKIARQFLKAIETYLD